MNLNCFCIILALLSIVSGLNTRLPGRIEAEAFTGKFDKSPENLGVRCGVAQTSPRVDLVQTNDPAGGNCHVAFIQPGEFLVYSTPIFARTADYQIRFRVSARSTVANTIRVKIGSVTKNFVWRGTGNGNEWTNLYVNFGRITQGPKPITITFVTGRLNFNFFTLRAEGNYNIEVGFNGVRNALRTRLLNQVETAARFWESVITADVPNGVSGVYNRAVDDLYIDVTFPAIDGPGNVLGSAGPREIRRSSNLPLSGLIRFDIADASRLLTNGQFDEVVRHEMGHVLGLGPLWKSIPGIIRNPTSSNPRYTRPFATLAFNTRFQNTLNSVPLANTGGEGSRLSHWRESKFVNELMTPFLNAGVANPVSRMSVQALRDLGYSIDLTKAEPYPRPSKKRDVESHADDFECRFSAPEMIVLP